MLDTHYENAMNLYQLPFMELLDKAHCIHKENFNPSVIQTSTLLSIKTGGCEENCAYCPQSVHHEGGIKSSTMLDSKSILNAAKRAKESGSKRFCMGASGKSPSDDELDLICEIITQIKSLGLEVCVTLGMIDKFQAQRLKEAGLDFYNHNIDTSKEFYKNIITTREFSDRIKTIKAIQECGLKVCCGGILGLGESKEDRIKMLVELASLNIESVPINQLVPTPGTPLESNAKVDVFDFIRIVALARILMPKAYIRLSAGRSAMSDEAQALCFYAGANSIFYGEVLLTTPNAKPSRDDELFSKLDLQKEAFLEMKY